MRLPFFVFFTHDPGSNAAIAICVSNGQLSHCMPRGLVADRRSYPARRPGGVVASGGGVCVCGGGGSWVQVQVQWVQWEFPSFCGSRDVGSGKHIRQAHRS